jgi:penicillin G amidase
MKTIKKTALALISIILLATCLLVAYLFYTKPTYEGEIGIKNIDKETTVCFDEFGVPHIYANSQKDALTVLGYVHAQDRLWQMELMRRIAPGRLSEIFGSAALKNDQFFVGLGIDENSQQNIAQLDTTSQTYKLATAYLDGINQYIKNGKTPVEFSLLGIKKEPYTLKDVYNIFGFMSFSFAMAQKTDPLLTAIRDKWGDDYLKDFGIKGELGKIQLKSYKEKMEDYVEVSKSVASLLDNLPIPPFIGSNSWVIGAEKTKNKKVILANDPHIGFSQPCTWYEAHIVTPEYEMYGYYLAGTPFPLLGHNRQYAYGLTMFENDDIDLFQETENPANPNQYMVSGVYKDYVIKNKIIKVKDSSDVQLQVKETVHGPVLNGLLKAIESKKPIAMSWIYTQQPNHILQAVYGLSNAKTLKDFYNGVSLIAAPGLNVMYGDAQNNIAWITSGKLYKLDASVNPNFILNGANGIDDKKQFLDFSKNPSAVNPTWHYVYSANNQPEAIENYLYPGYYLPQDRAKRIATLLEAKNDWTAQDVQKMIFDNTSAVSAGLVQKWMTTLNQKDLNANEKQALSILKSWQGTNNEADVAPTIYTKWLYFYLKNTFKDELGEEKFTAFLETHIMKQVIEAQSSNVSSIWWDDVTTKDKKETQAFILQKSFKEAMSLLQKQWGADEKQWIWGKVHTLEHQHAMGKVAALKPFFNVGQFQVSGTSEVINNLFFTFSENKTYEVKGGPSTRRVIDFSDIENSYSVLPTGQSGNPMSKHYNDQAELYNKGQFRKMKLNKDEIIKTSTKLVFVKD